MSDVSRLLSLGADDGEVRGLIAHLIAAFEAYVDEHETSVPSGFMAAHNFHKAIVIDIAKRSARSLEERRLVLTLAIDTFAQAIERELRKTGN